MKRTNAKRDMKVIIKLFLKSMRISHSESSSCFIIFMPVAWCHCFPFPYCWLQISNSIAYLSVLLLFTSSLTWLPIDFQSVLFMRHVIHTDKKNVSFVVYSIRWADMLVVGPFYMLFHLLSIKSRKYWFISNEFFLHSFATTGSQRICEETHMQVPSSIGMFFFSSEFICNVKIILFGLKLT